MLKNYKGIALTKFDTSVEASKVSLYATINNIDVLRVDKQLPCPKEYIPCGSVKWCLQSLKKTVTPNYYPEWLNKYLYRNVWKSDEWILGRKLFVKPADKYKRFTGFKTFGTYSKKKKPPYWYSDIVQFTNEWRYYISDGKILSGLWYRGDDFNTPDAPELDIDIPKGWCGTLDFGILSDGNLALVEAHHPFACGWYGVGLENIELYIKWLDAGWKYMQNIGV